MRKQGNKKLDFIGQNICVGFPTHSKQITVTIMGEHLHHKTISQPPDADVLAKYLIGIFRGNYYDAYESGIQDFGYRKGCKSQGVNWLTDIITRTND